MRDIERDAAVVTMANYFMQPEVYISPELFIRTYSDDAASAEELKETLYALDLIFTKRKANIWDEFPVIELAWKNEED